MGTAHGVNEGTFRKWNPTTHENKPSIPTYPAQTIQTMKKEATHKKRMCLMTYTITKPGNAQPLFGESREWLRRRQDWCLPGTQEDTQVPSTSISNVFPTLAGAKHLDRGTSLILKAGTSETEVICWSPFLLLSSFPLSELGEKGLLLTCPLRPQRVPSLIHLGLLHLAQSWVHINKYIIINKHRRINE